MILAVHPSGWSRLIYLCLWELKWKLKQEIRAQPRKIHTKGQCERSKGKKEKISKTICKEPEGKEKDSTRGQHLVAKRIQTKHILLPNLYS